MGKRLSKGLMAGDYACDENDLQILPVRIVTKEAFSDARRTGSVVFPTQLHGTRQNQPSPGSARVTALTRGLLEGISGAAGVCFPCDNPSQNHFAITRALSRSFRLAFTGEQR